MTRIALIRRAVMAGSSAALFAGCFGGGSTPIETTSGGGSGGSQASEIGSALQDEVESSVSSITLDEMISPIGLPPSSVCPTISGSADSDSDGIPDDLTLTFSNPPCSFSGIRGGIVELTGTLRVQDANPANAFDFTATLTNLVFSFAGPGGTRSFIATRNGTRSLTGSATGATLTENLTVLRQRPGRANATLVRSGTAAFTVDTGRTLIATLPLPAGTFDLGGTLDWHRSTENFSFTISTPVPLHYDTGCAGTPQRIKAGELRASGTIGSSTGYVRVLWTACGIEPTKSFVTVP